jgi:hypothetical protein
MGNLNKLVLKTMIVGLLATVMLSTFVLASTMTIRPDGPGNYAAWSATGCTAANGYQCVDESTVNTSDYVYTSASSKKETFTFGNTGLSSVTINSVTLYYYGKYYSSSKYKMQPLIRMSSTDYLGNILNLTSSYATYSQTYTTNPRNGSAWTVASVDALEAGMMSYTATAGGYVAQVYAVVDYTAIIPNSCNDTDGWNLFVQGVVSGYYNQTAYNNTDYCADTSNVTEYFCSGTRAYNSKLNCGNDSYIGSNQCISGDLYRQYVDFSCASGTCGNSSSWILQQDCGDDTSVNICYAGDVYTNYTDRFCSGSACMWNSTLTLYQDCTAGQYCSAGTCLYNNTCTDSDGGLNWTIAGSATGYLSQSWYQMDDACINSTNLLEIACSSYYHTPYNYTQNCVNATTGTTMCADGICQ